ncbi:MAG: hypothetical protein JWO77_169 [Ilumatobacteraceae bacterium]|nr:hypothetical protein [Ilumatobacteraceae bacterium]
MSPIVDDDRGALDDRPRGPLGRPASTIRPGIFRPDLGLVSGTEVFGDPTLHGDALAVAVGWLRADQAPTLGQVLVGPDEIDRWVHGPLDRIEASVPGRKVGAGIDALRRRLSSDLLGTTVTVSDLHGEVQPGRWWFDGTLEQVVAVDHWHPTGRSLPEVDVVALVMAARTLVGTSDLGLGAAVGDLLTSGWTADEREALGPGWNVNAGLRPSTALLLAWIEAVSTACGTAAPAGLGPDRQTRALLEQFAPDGLLDSPSTDGGLVFVDETAGLPAAEQARAAVASARRRTAAEAQSRAGAKRTIAGVSIAMVLWVTAVFQIDVAAMEDTGLLSILRPTGLVALAVLLACFCAELASPRPATWRLAAPVVALVAVIHGTPALLYGTLRYSWAWKHLGIIDFIHRHGAVDPTVKSLDVYHNWPGFFAANSAFTDQFGAHGAAGYARWWPLLANLAVIPALLYVFRGLRGGSDKRTSWLAVMMFLVANWIGQDYFSPQSLAFLLYLVVIGIVLQFTGTELRDTDRVGAARPRRWSVGVALLASATVITSHQVSPVVLLMALVALSLTRQAKAARIAGGVVVLAALWSTTGAWDFLSGNVASLVEGLGQPVANADKNLVDQGRLSAGQALVSTMGRVTLASIALLAIWGVVRELRRRRVDGAGIALLLAPAGLLFANTFGGEIAFRTYLFALPFLAWYAAIGIWPALGPTREALRRAQASRRAAAAFAATCLLLSGFLYGYFGKDSYYTFSEHEIAASGYVLEHAPPDALLVTVTANYPGQWERYEHLTYVPIASEPASSVRRIIADPVEVLSGWLSGDDYSKGYILLTRSQEREVEAMGVLPPGAFAEMRRDLDASPRFRTVYASPEAQVYELRSDDDGQ